MVQALMVQALPQAEAHDNVNTEAREAAPPDLVSRLNRRLARERRARHDAERLIEAKSLELYEANRALSALALSLEKRVKRGTRELSKERLKALKQSESDSLTGIANRAAFARQLDEVLTNPAARKGEAGVAALLLDLDDFKTINDTLGHAAGDSLLVQFSQRLTALVGPSDIVARLGGDEFAVIVRGWDDGKQLVAMVEHFLLPQLCQPAHFGGRKMHCSCSIGIAIFCNMGASPDELLRDAGLALYQSKRLGRGRVTLFEHAMRDELIKRAALDAELRSAVTNGHIVPWYQPIRRSSTGTFIGAEVLARWHRPDGQVCAPASFLDAVEALDLLDSMMENILRCAFREARPLIMEGVLGYLSINVSPNQFNQGWALNCLPALLDETSFPAHALVIEITETALLNDIDRTREMLSALSHSGVRIALDDFGIGYSNFSLLRQLPIDLLKLDRSLVCDIEHDERAIALAEGILSLAERLNLTVVAEGVETKRQVELLESAGCAAFQGYWFSRPKQQLSNWFTVDRFCDDNRATDKG